MLDTPKKQPRLDLLDPEDGVDVTHLVGIMQLGRHSCRWPYGDPKEAGFGFCGRAVIEGSSYCAEHDHRAHHSEPMTRAEAEELRLAQGVAERQLRTGRED